MFKRSFVTAFAVAVLFAMALPVFGGGTAQAHEEGHPDGCAGFGELVSGMLAGPGFGEFLSEFAPSAPQAVSGMVDLEGHSACD